VPSFPTPVVYNDRSKEAAVNITEPGYRRDLAGANRRYSAFSTKWETEQTAGTPSGARDPLFLVVGFDGTEPAQRALETAVRLLHDRDGTLEVVYVAHVPSGAAMSAELRISFDDLAVHLATDVRHRLGAHEPRWHFQRRDGTVSRELSAVADELRRRYGPEARVAIIVGGSAHKGHHVLGSVSANLERLDRFPIMVIP
jgi:nucleotide-binding universal stress UspA family protein